MKKVIFSWLLSAMIISTATAQFQANRTGYEGDNFSLEGALELFKDSRSVQDFERRLNTRTNWVNNLDLDYDGRTDYIRVNQRRQGGLNAIVLQVPVDRQYVQDVAVIQIEQTGRRQATLQMVGDADLYGQNVFIEPYSQNNNTVNVYSWRAVRDILDGSRNIYASPYAYNYYPTWYNPWNQFAWNVYQPRIARYGYSQYYRVSRFNRLANVYNFYSPYRAYCPAVRQRTVLIRNQRPAVNRAVASRATTTRNNRTNVQTTRSRATTRQTQATTNRANTSTRRATTSVNRSTSRATASTSRANTPTTRSTNRATSSNRTSRASTPVNRSTSRASVNRSTPTRSASTARTSRSTTQSRSSATPSRASSTQSRSTSTASRSNATVQRSTRKRQN